MIVNDYSMFIFRLTVLFSYDFWSLRLSCAVLKKVFPTVLMFALKLLRQKSLFELVLWPQPFWSQTLAHVANLSDRDEVLRSEPCLFASHPKLCRLSHLSWMFSLFVWLWFWPWHRQSSPAGTLCCASWESEVSVCCGSAKLSSAFKALEALALLVPTQVDTWTPLTGRNSMGIFKFSVHVGCWNTCMNGI